MGEGRREVIAIAATIALLVACTGGPLVLARRVHPAAGSVAAGFCAVLWSRLVRPMPGLIQGIVCLAGLAAIPGILLACLLLVGRPRPDRAPGQGRPAAAVDGLRTEPDRRIAEMGRNPKGGIPWEVVKSRVLVRFPG